MPQSIRPWYWPAKGQPERTEAFTWIAERVTGLRVVAVALMAAGVALAYCTVLIILMSLAIALIQFLVGERKLGRRAVAGPANALASP